jgi:hypothetical protein
MSRVYRSIHRTHAGFGVHGGANECGEWKSAIHLGRRTECGIDTSREALVATPKEVCREIDLKFDINREIDKLSLALPTIVSAAVEVHFGMVCHIIRDIDLIFISTTSA